MGKEKMIILLIAILITQCVILHKLTVVKPPQVSILDSEGVSIPQVEHHLEYGKSTFIEPMTPEERFKRARSIDDLLI